MTQSEVSQQDSSGSQHIPTKVARNNRNLTPKDYNTKSTTVTESIDDGLKEGSLDVCSNDYFSRKSMVSEISNAEETEEDLSALSDL